MTLFVLKLIAAGTMVIDHVGILFFPGHTIMRVIGRLAFPIFAWGIANGYHHTTNAKKYLWRLIVLAGISQVPYGYMFGTIAGFPFRMNIFVTLALGLGAIMLYERFRHDVFLQSLSILILVVLSFLIPTGYGVYGLVMILLFHTTYGRAKDMMIWQTVWIVCMLVFAPHILSPFPHIVSIYLAIPSAIQVWSLGALPIIALYNEKIGNTTFKWWFYWFYPIHLAVLFILYIFGRVA